MNIKQINDDNTGVRGTLPGYSATDALHFADRLHISYLPLAVTLAESFPNAKKWLELGSGAGSFMCHLRAKRDDIIGVTLDGCPAVKESSPFIDPEKHFVVRTDVPYHLVDDDNNTVLFDMIVSFEHFEHIQDEHFEVFLQNIRKHCHKDTIIIATAANWGDGQRHCNVKQHKEWIDYLTSMGWVMLEETYVTQQNTPFNFNVSQSAQLTFKPS